MFTSAFGIGLGKLLKNQFLILLRYPGPGIRDFKTKLHVP